MKQLRLIAREGLLAGVWEGWLDVLYLQHLWFMWSTHVA